MDGQLKLAAIVVGGRGSENVGLPISELLSLLKDSACPSE